jgi:hypothetical protein
MTIEGAASLLLGWASKSLLLEAFGIDSIIELFSAAVLLWRLRVEASSAVTSEHVSFVEDRAARLVGYSLYVLVAYVLLNSGYGLFIAKRITDTRESVLGHSHRGSGKGRHANSGRLQNKSRSSIEFPCAKSRRDRIDHMRLPVDRFDDRFGSDKIARLVVGG